MPSELRGVGCFVGLRGVLVNLCIYGAEKQGSGISRFRYPPICINLLVQQTGVGS